MSSKVTIGCLTIGQSPRPEIINELADLLPRNCRLTELGALDGQSPTQLLKATPVGNEAFYVTLLSDGTEIKVSKLALEGLIRNSLEELQRRGADLAVLLCTGEFPPMATKIPFFRGSEITKARVKQEYCGQKIAVVVPDPDQAAHMSQRWLNLGIQHDIYDCSPYYETEQSQKLCAQLRKSQVDFIVLDCFGFTLEMANCFRQQTGKHVLLPREIVGEYITSYIKTNMK
ncbi:MAG: AroM family protein [Bacillota bacterium]|jgi:protein AroM